MLLNGTPIALGIQDLWSQYEFLDPNIIGTGDYWAFKTRYVEMGGYENKQIVGYKNLEELMKLIVPYTIEVGKDVLNLPPKVMKPLYCEATAEQKKLFRLVIKGTTGDPNEPIIKVDNTLEKMLRLRQIVGGYLPRTKFKKQVINGEEQDIAYTVIEPLKENPKLDLLLDLVDDHRLGSKFIIWTTFIHEIELIRDKLAEKYGPRSVECYYGGTAMEDRSAIEDRYCNDPTMRFFVGNPVAAGLGLTLISGESDIMVYYSGTNAYIDRAQSEDRAHRIGQKNSVVVADLVMEKTVDELIQASIATKMNIEEYVMNRVAQGIKLDDLLLGDGEPV
jgi:SNF2 family DNA or RNA helicase